MQLAQDMGMKYEQRPIELEELSTFEEAGACGTAAVISPISQVDDIDTGKTYQFGSPNQAGPVTEKLYKKLRAIQYGDEPDTHGWVTIIDPA